MGLDLSNNANLYKGIMEHYGHDIEVANYGEGTNVAIECATCYTVLIDVNLKDCEESE